MKVIFFKAEIVFFEGVANKMFNFQVERIGYGIRPSFWLEVKQPLESTPSEVMVSGNIEMGKPYDIDVAIINRDFLEGKLAKDVKFYLGVYPMTMAEGKILLIYDDSPSVFSI